MYTQKEKDIAIRTYITNGKNAAKTIEQLGYPTFPSLVKWYNSYHPLVKEKTKGTLRHYTEEEKQHAINLYFKNGCNMKKTVRELDYGSATGILKWVRERYPDKASKPVLREWMVDYPVDFKQKVVTELLEKKETSEQISKRYGISRATLYEWKLQYMGKGSTELKQERKSDVDNYIKEIEDLRKQKELIEEELQEVKKQLYKAKLEKDVYEKAAEILKKEMACSLKEFTNREKAMVIAALKEEYPIKAILEVFDMAKSSYSYQKKQLEQGDKYQGLRYLKRLFSELCVRNISL